MQKFQKNTKNTIIQMDQKFQKKIGSYMLQKLIGTGSFAKVYKGIDTRTSESVAIKMISKDSLDPSRLSTIEKEINILRSLQHPNIILIKDIKRTPNNIYLILEYCHLGDLENYLEKYYYDKLLRVYHMPETVVQQIVKQLAEGFKLMRERSIVHRDLKLANILVSKDFVIKLADFGFARFQENSNFLLESFCGTPITMAPEILKKQNYNEKCDIWSLGVIIYKMLVGKYPFFPNGKCIEDLVTIVEKGVLNFPASIVISEGAKDLIRRMLVIDVGKRMGFEEFFAHEWVNAKEKKAGDLKKQLLSVYEEKSKEKRKISVEIAEICDKKEEKHEEKKEEKCEKIEEKHEKFEEKCEEKHEKCEEKQEIFDAKELDIERLSLDSEPRSKENCDILRKRANKQILDFFQSRVSDFLVKIEEIQEIIENFKENDSEVHKLLVFLLNMTIANEIKRLISEEISFFINKTFHFHQKINKFDVFSSEKLKKKFKLFYAKIEENSNFCEIYEENPRNLLYRVFLEVSERNIVNEYILDLSNLKDSYVKLVKIAEFLKKKTFLTSFSVNFSCDLEGKYEEWLLLDSSQEDSFVKFADFEENEEFYEEYEEISRLLHARIRNFDEIQ